MKKPSFINKKIFQFRQWSKKKKRLFAIGTLCTIVLVVIGIGVRYSIHTELVPPDALSADLHLAQFSDKKVNNQKKNNTQNTNPPVQNPTSPAVPAPITSGICAVKLTLTPEESTITQNGNINYAMQITNTGSVTCQNASISIYYADNETFVSSDPKATASNYYWSLGNLAGGAIKNFSITTVGSNNGSEPQVHTEACGTADNSADSCSDSTVAIGTATVPSTTTQNTNTPLPAAVSPSPTTQNNTAVVQSSGQEYGTWVWVSPLKITKTYADTIVNAAVANNINVLYVTFDDYLDIADLPNGANKMAQIKNYSSAVASLVDIAQQKGIAVDAEAGAQDWGDPANHAKAFAIIDYLNTYNASHPSEKIRGFQYDVESYLLPEYNDNQETTLANFISLIDDTVSHLANSNLRFAVVLPHFYDDVVQWTPIVTYKNTENYTFNFVLQLLDKRPNSSIIIMAYRNFAEGVNGSIDLSNTEVTEASSGSHSTKIIVAQETGNVTPSYVTFYGMSKSDYITQVNLIIDNFKNYSAFGGIAVHYIDPFLQLK